MGGSSSLPSLPNNQLYFVLVGQNAEQIPFIVPPGHPILSLNLQKNLIRILPPDLPQLKTLILSENSIEEINPEMKHAILSYPSLQSLDLARNQITEFEISIKSLQSLNIIQNRLQKMPELSENLITGAYDFNIIRILDQSSPVIQTLTLSLNYIDTVNSDLKFDKLITFDCSMNRIAKIDNFSTMFPSIKTTNLSFNKFTQFPSPLSQTLVEIDLSYNEIVTVPDEIEQLSNLQTINLSYNKITALPKLPSSLQSIFATNNKIVSIADAELPNLQCAVFSNNELPNLPKLTNHISPTLFFSHNHIQAITLEMMIRPVEQLNLADNEITEIPIELFSMPRLRILNLDSNKITSIPEEIVNSNISTLLISQNNICKLPIMPKSLLSLYASYCNIDDISECFNNCSYLNKLCLNGNPIKKFPVDVNFLNLEVLCLSQCELELFPYSLLIFPELSNKIRTLDLSCNHITSVPEEFSAPNLTEFDLSHNQLNQLPDFVKFQRLTVLKLTSNPIHTNIQLLKNPFLDSVDLYSTKISRIEVVPTVREVLTQTHNLQKPFRRLVCTKTGYSQFLGMRKHCEDSILVRDDLHFYCICDGHNGSQTSTAVANLLPEIYEQPHEFSGDFAESTIQYVEDYLKSALNVSDGATIVCAEINYPQIITSHLGDARAIIVSETGQAKTLTKDHKPTVRAEFEKIMHAGGRVSQGRTNGVLGISRALGDFEVVGLGRVPEITHVSVEENDKYIVMACDGLFNVLTNDEVAALVSGCNSATEAAYTLKNMAFACGTQDNISVIVIPLK